MEESIIIEKAVMGICLTMDNSLEVEDFLEGHLVVLKKLDKVKMGRFQEVGEVEELVIVPII